MPNQIGATTDPDGSYLVVVNQEDQHSVWWADREIPAGWRATGATGTRAECLAAIEAAWTDMRPASLRGEPA